MPTADDGIDTMTLREGIEPDANADGNAPFRCPMWFADSPEPDSGVYLLTPEIEAAEAEHYWRAG